MTTKIVCWNIARRNEPWRWLLDMDADVALLQEAAEPPSEVAARVEIDPAPWDISGEKWNWRTAVVRLSDRVRVDWISSATLTEAERGEFAASWPGTLSAATVTPPGGEPFIVLSMYAWWENPHSSVGNWIYSDATAHRVVSDLSTFIGGERDHRILAAGDLNSFYGYHPHGDVYWAARYQTVFTRMGALGVPLVGPQAPHGRQADPWPDELPKGSKNVPTFHSNRQTPATATRQLDYVFASRDLSDSVSVRALNEPEQWGPSDHCRLDIRVA
ncbi:MAG: hypothetical protein OXG79_10390 [Chloroflexi bacterium]|nr:hypothetical protein [Chloroflexota bacterium]